MARNTQTTNETETQSHSQSQSQVNTPTPATNEPSKGDRQAAMKKAFEDYKDRDKLVNKSQKIRFFHKQGYTRSEIATYLNIKYQFVRNVLIQDAGREAQQNAGAA